MVAQIGSRRIGNVMIIDIKGELVGSAALRGRGQISQALSSEEDEKVVFNLRHTTGLDTLGLKSMIDSISPKKDIGIVHASTEIMDLLNRYSERRRFRVFRDEQEIVSAFGKDFVSSASRKEQRRTSRLETALPLEFSYQDGDERIEFQAIVTNLSEMGLFAEYIDLKSAEESLKRLNPYDLNMLHLILHLPKRKAVIAEGKVVHRRLEGEQVGIGIEFCRIDSKEHDEIRNFLKHHDMKTRTFIDDGKEGIRR